MCPVSGARRSGYPPRTPATIGGCMSTMGDKNGRSVVHRRRRRRRVLHRAGEGEGAGDRAAGCGPGARADPQAGRRALHPGGRAGEPDGRDVRAVARNCANRARSSRRKSPTRRPTRRTVGSYLKEADGEAILGDVEDFGRKHPWAVMAGGRGRVSRFAVPEGVEQPRAETGYQAPARPTSTNGSTDAVGRHCGAGPARTSGRDPAGAGPRSPGPA